MDLSKLPKLSRTSEHQPPPSPPDATQPPDAPEPAAPSASSAGPSGSPAPARGLDSPAIGLAEAWISIGLGVLILFIFPNTIRYIHGPAQFDQDFPVTDANNNNIPYIQSIFFWTDLGVTVFAVALILEGIILAIARKPAPLWFAFLLTSAAAMFNIGVIIHAYPILGFHILCGVAVVILGYMALTQLRLIQFLRQLN